MKRSCDTSPGVYHSYSRTKRLESVSELTSARSDKKMQKTLENLSRTTLAKIPLSNFEMNHLRGSHNDEDKWKKGKSNNIEELMAFDGPGTLFLSPPKSRRPATLRQSVRGNERLLQVEKLRRQERARGVGQKRVQARQRRHERPPAAVARKTAAAQRARDA